MEFNNAISFPDRNIIKKFDSNQSKENAVLRKLVAVKKENKLRRSVFH